MQREQSFGIKCLSLSILCFLFVFFTVLLRDLEREKGQREVRGEMWENGMGRLVNENVSAFSLLSMEAEVNGHSKMFVCTLFRLCRHVI